MGEGQRESSGCVLGVALGFAVLAAFVWRLAVAPAAAVDGEALLNEWFELDELPFGLQVVDGVRAGSLTVLLENPDAPEEAPKNEVAEEQEDDADDADQADDADDDLDWSALVEGPRETAPIEVAVTHYPNARAAVETLEHLFGRPGSDAEEEGPSQLMEFGAEGGRAPMDRGRLPWNDYNVLFVWERELERGGTFRDLIRVNLTLPGRACVISARWPRGYPASKEKMKELIAAFHPHPPEQP